MAAVAHNKEFAKKVGVPQKVGKEFNAADQDVMSHHDHKNEREHHKKMYEHHMKMADSHHASMLKKMKPEERKAADKSYKDDRAADHKSKAEYHNYEHSNM